MSTRLMLRGRLAWANAEARADARTAYLRDGPPARTPPEPGEPAPYRGVQSFRPNEFRRLEPFQAGVPYYCPEEHVTYRVVERLDPNEGWNTAQFWQRRWLLRHVQVLQLARAGLLDAALERGSQVRRFRCRDEMQVLRHDVVLRAALERRPPSEKPRRKTKA